MAASVEYRQEEMSSEETTEKDKSDEMSLFVDFNDINLNLKLVQKSDQSQETLDSESGNPLMPETISVVHGQNHPGADDLLNSEDNTTDYDWLLSPPRNATLSLGMEEEKKVSSQNLISNGESTAPEFRLENPRAAKSCSGGVRRPSPSRKATSTPTTTRPTLPSTVKPLRSSTPTVAPSKRSTIPTLRPSITAAAVGCKSKSRSSTPTPRPSMVAAAAAAASKSTSRSSTPTHRSCSITKSGAPNLKKSLLERPASASRVRQAIPSVTETNSKAIPKRSYCSPLRGQISNGSVKSRSWGNDDDVNPVLMGTKMVERVVNMRKLPPPNQNNNNNTCGMTGKLSVSQDNSGFGRTLSKKSFDMALRHLDIRRSMPGNMRAMITKVPASSVYSVRPPTDSPHATCSSACSSNHNQ